MDHFGIGQAMEGMARAYFQASRATGRTVSLIESVKDGDRIVCATRLEAQRLKQLCKERGVEVACIVVPPHSPQRLFDGGTPQGRTVFDHTWVEIFYTEAIKRCQADIDKLQEMASGYGEPHRETLRRAQEMMKWR